MDHKPNNPILVSLTGLIGLLGVGWLCDAAMQFLQYRNEQTFSLSYGIFWAYALVALLVAAAWLLVAWMVLVRLPRNVWGCLVYLLVGLLIVAYPALYYTPALCCGLPNIDLVHLEPATSLYSTGGFAAIVGLAGLVWRRQGKKE